VLLFHQQQAAQWSLLSDSIESYLDSVRELAEKMAVDGEGGQSREGRPGDRKVWLLAGCGGGVLVMRPAAECCDAAGAHNGVCCVQL
jgi:hypothetical protein